VAGGAGGPLDDGAIGGEQAIGKQAIGKQAIGEQAIDRQASDHCRPPSRQQE
jgi:hypothetical protein